MGRTETVRTGVLCLAVGSMLTLAGCATDKGSETGFRKTYLVARTALEGGDYARANRQFDRLMDSAGPFRSRIQLEYAHSLLRAGDFAEAARMAEAMAEAETGAASGAALAVAGTARHEMGLAALSAGQTEAGRTQLRRAAAAMAEVLDTHPELDPLGALAGRQASIAVRLQAL